MSRPLTLSNGRLHVGLNERAEVSDFYYPHVGQENHVAGSTLHHRIGVWVSGRFSWIDDDGWSVTIGREAQALIGLTVATNLSLGVRLEFTDAVFSGGDVFVRNIHVCNLNAKQRKIRVFMHQVFAIGDSRSNTDTAQYLPENHAILHYRGRRAFVIGGSSTTDQPFDAHSIGLYGIEGREGTFRDAEDGKLGNNTVEHGRVDSVIGFHLSLGAHDSSRVYYWIACGESTTEALRMHMELRTHGIQSILRETAGYWRGWLKPALTRLPQILPQYHDLFISSLLILKSHTDHDGAIIASTDTTMLNYSRDAYAYCWPRDGAYVMWPFIRLGYRGEPLAFFRFIARVIHPGGYLMHKYFADGSLGPSWHPYVHGDTASAPIQEDETATVLFMLAEFIRTAADPKIIEEFYDSLITPMATFLCNFLDDRTGLPKPSYDPWEEIFQTGTYTVASVYGALAAASDMAEQYAHPDDALRWQAAADAVQAAAHKHLFNRERGFFYKGLTRDKGTITHDQTIDSASLYGALTFGLYAHDSDEVISAMRTVFDTLSAPDNYDGTARYENDAYNRNEHSGVGNPWFITSLWQAQAALYHGDSARADMIIDWVADHAEAPGILSEQADRVTGAPLSVAPLAWSHAELINTLLDRGASA